MNRYWLIILGVLLILGGVLTLIHPFPASLTIEIFAGWAFLVLGILQIVAAFRHRGDGSALWLGLIGALMALIGVELLRDPLAGLVALTAVVAIAFIVSGLIKLALWNGLRGTPFGWGILLSGAVSILLGIMVLTNIPMSAAVLLGTLLGIEMISSGVTTLLLASALRQA